MSRRFQYDDLYRVIKADYKYEAGDDTWKSPFDAELNAVDGAGDPRRAEPSPHVAFAKRILWQSYQYDWLGNTRTSNDDAKGFYDRSLGTITNGTTKAYQLTGADNTTLGNSSDGVNRTGSLSTTYDNSGNLTKLEVTRNGKCAGATSGTCSQSFFYSWDEVGRLVRARRWDQASVPAGLASPAVDLQYHYAAGDSRVLKTARSGNQEVHTAYIFPSLELRRAEFDGDAPGDYTLDSSTEVAYLFANGVRLARLVHQPLDSAGDGKLLRVFFELGDHLGSTSVALDKDTGELVERSTYQAYGGAESSYRPSKWGDFREDYRFTGKEEDVEVGLTYFGKRYLNIHLQRWMSPDPLTIHGLGGDPNCYAYVSGRALAAIDPLGLDSTAQKTDAAVDKAAATKQVADYSTVEPYKPPADQCFASEQAQAEHIKKKLEYDQGYNARASDYYRRAWATQPSAQGPQSGDLNERAAAVTQSPLGSAKYLQTGSLDAANEIAIADPLPAMGKAPGGPVANRSAPRGLMVRVAPRPAPVGSTQRMMGQIGARVDPRASSPIRIPESVSRQSQSKVGYEQIRYRWSEGGNNYEARWHTRTPGAPAEQGTTWVVTRSTPGSPTGRPKVEHVLTGPNQWTPMSQWQEAVKANQTGTATADQKALLKAGHWSAE